jgi:serine/threonine-protein kinase
MAPEQARGAALDPRADIFAAGAVLFEMLSGRPAFQGTSAIDVLHAVIYDHPPALVGSAAIAEIDRIIHRALAKTPEERYHSSDTMASELRACLARTETGVTATVTATRRLIVLPFRNLRPDPDTEFLAFSLPDAITVALSGLESLVIRSTLVAARYTATDIDPRALASDAAVDAVVMGTLLRAHNRVRVTVQLVEVPIGTLLWSQAMEVPIEDLFQIQDRVARAVVTALSVPMSSTERRQLQHDIPANPEAYGLYLRANRLMDSASRWQDALTLYRQAVELDPRYAPAWARLGRCLRLLGKYGDRDVAGEHVQDAKAAFARAFELNPDLSLAHNLYTYAEVENGRAQDAMTRLLGRLRSRQSDPELYAGLVHACRYCGLLDASIAADAHARRLDPGIVTSVVHSFFMKGDFDKAIARDTDNPPYVTLLALTFSGRRAEARAIASGLDATRVANQTLRLLLSALQAMLENRVADTVDAVEQLEAPSFSDPEGWFYWAHLMAGLGDIESAVSFLDRTVTGGWVCVNALERSPGLEAVQSHPSFASTLARARRAEAEAAHAFAAADGPRLLGFASAASHG